MNDGKKIEQTPLSGFIGCPLRRLLRFTTSEESGSTPIDQTGKVFTATIREYQSPNAPLIATFDFEDTESSHEKWLVLSEATSATIKPGEFYYDVVRRSGTAEPEVIVRGPIQFEYKLS